MKIRDRIVRFTRVRAGDLAPHPRNWRVHPASQQEALRGVLSEIGYADALIARELPDGSLQLVDGHLRAETTPDMEVPVMIVDLSDEEAAKMLALHDPIGAMAETDAAMLAALSDSFETESEALSVLLDQMLDREIAAVPIDPPPEIAIPEVFQVVVECADEAHQREVFQHLLEDGFTCRLLNL